MGMFDFVKSIGEKISSSDKIDKADLRKHIDSLGLPIERFMASFNEDGESVDIFGWVADLATKEKLIVAVGNIRGISKVNSHLRIGKAPPRKRDVASAAATEEEEEEEEVGEAITEEEDVALSSKFYTVKSGDYLSKIAKEVYGNGNRYLEIFEANKPMLKDPDDIYPGQVLRIPQG